MSFDEKKIKDFVKFRIEGVQEKIREAEAIRKRWDDKTDPIFSAIAGMWEAFLGELENQCRIDELLLVELVEGRKRWEIAFEWIEYFKAEINRLKMTSKTVSSKPVEIDKKVEALEKKQQDWEKKYTPILEHLEIWIRREIEKQKRAKQIGLV